MGKKFKTIKLSVAFYVILFIQIIAIPFVIKTPRTNPLQWIWIFLFLWQLYALKAPSGKKRFRGSLVLRKALKISLTLIMMTAVSLRLFRIFSVPPGLWVDELYTASNALDLNVGEYWKNPFYMTPLVGEGWVETSNLYLYFIRLLWLIFGMNYIGMKMASILPGAAAAFFLYFLARKLWGFRAGLAASFFFAINAWQIGLSRWGWDEVLLTALQIPVFLFLWKGLRRGKYFDFALSGFLLGLCLYAHAASRILVVFAILYLLLELVLSPKIGNIRFRGLWIFFLFFLICAAPFGIYMSRNPTAFWARYKEISIFAQMDREKSVFPLLSNIWNHLLMFHGTSDPNIRHHIPDKPVLDLISGLFMIIGILVTLLGLKRRKNRFVLLWLFFGLLGGILTLSPGGPQTYRTGITGPPAFILCGIGLAWAIRISKGLFDISKENYRYINISIAVLLALSLGINVHRYFIAYPDEPRLWREFWGSEETFFAREVGEKEESGERVLLDSAFRSNYYFLHKTALEVIGGAGAEYFDPIARTPIPGAGKTQVIIPAFRKDFYEAAFPEFALRPVKNPLGEESLYSMTVDSESLRLCPEIPSEKKHIYETTFFRDNTIIRRETRERLDIRDIPEQTKGIIIKTSLTLPKREYALLKIESGFPFEMSIDGTMRDLNDKNEAFVPLKQGANALEIRLRDVKDWANVRLFWRPHFKTYEEIPSEFLSLAR